MENISVNKLVESTNSNLPRDLKIEFAKNILSSIKNPEDAKKFELLINKLSLKKQENYKCNRYCTSIQTWVDPQ